MQIRDYQPGDEKALIALFDRAYANYSGYVTRTPEHWRWCILDRPGVSPDDIVVLEQEKVIAAYGILGPKGAVLELAVDSGLPESRREELATRLVDELEYRSRRCGNDRLRIQVPSMEPPLRRALDRKGYLAVPCDSLQWVIVDLAGFVSRVLQHRKRQRRLEPEWQRSFLLEIEPGNYHFHPHPRIFVRTAPTLIVEANPQRDDAEATIATDLSTLTDLVFRITSVEQIIQSGLACAQPDSATPDMEKLLSLLVLDRPWYTPMADGR